MLLKCYIGQLLYVDRFSAVTLPLDCNADEYSSLLLKEYGPCRILWVTECPLMVDKHGSVDIISIDRTAFMTRSTNHLYR